jgi:predicted N-acetyltransferase YhbS
VTVRPLAAADVDAVAEVDFAAFQDVALRHGQTPLVAAVRDSRFYVRRLLDADPLGGFVAEDRGTIVGHAWVHARGPIATVGPIAVEPRVQGRGVGRALLERCLEAAGPRVSQVRLVQESFNVRSLGFYLAAGFRIAAPVVELELAPATVVAATEPPAGTSLRAATVEDVQRIATRDARAFGTQRTVDVERRLRAGRGLVAEREKRLVGYALGGHGALGSSAADDPDVGLALLTTLATDAALRTTVLRAMVLGTDRLLVDGLLAAGFRLFRACHYMTRGGGTAPPAGYVLMSGDYM